jgi:lipopolysaccharide/colanic/teichoic acid biosynthesis glycosyltransferase
MAVSKHPYPLKNDSAVVARPLSSPYGHASGATTTITVARPMTNVADLSGLSRLQFWAGEVLGLLFVALSSIYIFVVPVSWTRQSLAEGVMRRVVKRVVDIIGSLIGLIVTSPFWVVLPILIKLDSKGPVFYTQTRVGENRRRGDRRLQSQRRVRCHRTRERRREDYLGKPFKLIKFRTMVADAESASGPVWAKRNDPRITRVGRILRKTRLDEIPQFLNVLKGDMSLVGPRPERPAFVKDLSGKIDNYTARLQVKPGLTGLAQVENGYDSSLDSVVRKVRFDLKYIGEWSLWVDLKILCRTVLVVLTGRGAC